MRYWIGLLPSVLLLACAVDEASSPLPPVDDPIPYVDPRIGSGGLGYAYGAAFPGACAPHGLVKLGPDTSGELGTLAFQHFSGYYAEDDTIESFSHMHLHGTGLSDYGLVGVMPAASFDPAETKVEHYAQKFDEQSEQAEPGYYAVTLTDGTQVELTARVHSGLHRYHLPAEHGALVIDLSKHLSDGTVDDAELDFDAATGTLTGRLHSMGSFTKRFGGHDVFVVAVLSTPVDRFWSWGDGDAVLGQEHAEGARVGLAVDVGATRDVELRVGLSLVSLDGARANLAAEIPDFDFDAVRRHTTDDWRDLLSTILVEGGSERTRRIFYSALYRSFVMPTITSDVDGHYVYAGKVGNAGSGRFMTDMSLWDTYRTVHPLYALIAPDSARNSVRSLIAMHDLGGAGFPRWPIATGESAVMLGSSADVVIADATIKGVGGFDAAQAFSDLWAAAMDPHLQPAKRGGRNPSDDYITLGYVPASHSRPVSTTMEFGIDDYALGAMASALGHDIEGDELTERALHGFPQLYDPDQGFFRARSVSGTFPGDFDPEYFLDDYAEADALQTLWAPIFDLDGLAGLVGGRDDVITRLSGFFDAAETDLRDHPIDSVDGSIAPRTYYWHGNEPDIHAAYIFGQFGRDDLTQRWLAWITNELYSVRPDGLAGNDDGGTLSAWYVFTALGIYPVSGTSRYFLGAPMFPRIRVRTAWGSLVIEAPGADEPGRGVDGVDVDGVPLGGAGISHDQLEGTAVMSFHHADHPTSWTTVDGDHPYQAGR